MRKINWRAAIMVVSLVLIESAIKEIFFPALPRWIDYSICGLIGLSVGCFDPLITKK